MEMLPVYLLVVLPAVIAFAMARFFGRLAGWISVGVTFALHLPTLIWSVPLIVVSLLPVGPEAGPAALETNGGIGAGGWMALGGLTFVAVSMAGAIIGARLGQSRFAKSQEVAP